MGWSSPWTIRTWEPFKEKWGIQNLAETHCVRGDEHWTGRQALLIKLFLSPVHILLRSERTQAITLEPRCSCFWDIQSITAINISLLIITRHSFRKSRPSSRRLFYKEKRKTSFAPCRIIMPLDPVVMLVMSGTSCSGKKLWFKTISV